MNKSKRIITLVALLMLVFAIAGCPEKQASPINSANKTAKMTRQQPAGEPVAQKKSPVKITRTKTQETNGVSGKIKFEKAVHDFGEQGAGKYVNCEFKFTNVGKGTLKMPRKPTAPCGCTIPKLDKMEYAPGESGVIKVRFHTPSVAGSVSKSAYVYTNDEENKVFELTLKAEVILVVTANPKALNLSIKEDNGGIKPITVKTSDGVAFSITNFTSTNQTISADIDKTAKATEFVLNPKVDMEKLLLKSNGRITINLTHPETKQLTLSYSAPPLFKASNNRIIIFNPDPSKPELRDITIMSNYDQDVEIESIKSAKNYMEVTEQVKKGKNVMLKVKVTPPAKEGSIRYFYDFMTINIKDGNPIKITTSGTYPLQKINARK